MSDELDRVTASYLDGLLSGSAGPPPRLCTVGYGGRKSDELTTLLRDRAVTTVVDVRLRPDRAALGAYPSRGRPP